MDTIAQAIKGHSLALHNISAKWTLPIRDWKPAMSQFMLMYGDRISG
ncbi:hypothetical protein [Symbiopectobacterium purcellii]